MSDPDPLRRAIPDEVRVRLRRFPDQEVQWRLSVLTASGPAPSGPSADTVNRLRMQRAAWEAYVLAAEATGILDTDVTGRMCSPRSEEFRSAMAECMASWTLSARLGFDVGPRTPERAGNRRPDFPIQKGGVSVVVEVKAPWNRIPEYEGAFFYDEADSLSVCIAEANAQFGKGPNLLVLVPSLALPLRREVLVNAFLGRERIAFQVVPEPKGFEVSSTFVPNGPLLKHWGTAGPRYTRTSAVLVIEEVIGVYRALSGEQLRVGHRLFVIHNPNAAAPIAPHFFGGHPQLVPRQGEMVWTSEADATEFAREADRWQRVSRTLDRMTTPDPIERERKAKEFDRLATLIYPDGIK